MSNSELLNTFVLLLGHKYDILCNFSFMDCKGLRCGVFEQELCDVMLVLHSRSFRLTTRS